ncbi:MFS domain-containing protein [Mycena kentingensis (nom. inval.)]|nr:MFS domain-containing protein [Mycena kentingensis (nom. inval.)]
MSSTTTSIRPGTSRTLRTLGEVNSPANISRTAGPIRGLYPPLVSMSARDADAEQSTALDSGSTPERETFVEPKGDVRTLKQHRVGRVQFVALCGVIFLNGWTDGALGPLIPKIQEYYRLSYTTVSLLFVFKCVGFVLGGLVNILLSNKLGFGNLLFFGSFLPIIGSAIQSSAAASASSVPFAVFVLGTSINGIGLGIIENLATGYVASFRFDKRTKMGVYESAYGLGALVSPIVATQFSMLARPGRWAFCYLIIVGLAMASAVDTAVVFGRRTHAESLARIGQLGVGVVDEKTAEEEDPALNGSLRSLFAAAREMMTIPAVHLMALFCFVYVGTEVMVGGWIVTFMINVRGGGDESGYVAAGFWGGFMLGRVALLPLSKWIGEMRAIYLYIVACIGLEFIIWFVPSFVASAIAVAFIGFFFGPVFPITVNHTARILPPRILTPTISWLAAVGSAGSSVLPLIAGAIAGKVGFKSMQPLTIGTLALIDFVSDSSSRRLNRTMMQDANAETSTLVEPNSKVEADLSRQVSLTLRSLDVEAASRSPEHRRTERVQLAALCGVLFASGYVDGSLGPLIPKIQEFYMLSYTKVSLIFVFKCIGYIVGAFFSILVTHKYGSGNLMLGGLVLLIIGNALQAAALGVPFEVYVLGNFFVGLGFGTANPQAVGYVASLRVSQSTKMGIFQAFYGLGCLVSPLVTTQFVNLRQRGYWAYSNTIPVGLTILNAVSLSLVFGRRTQQENLARICQLEADDEPKIPEPHAELEVPMSAGYPATPITPRPIERSHLSSVKQVMALKVVHLLTLFSFMYVGTEVTISGWIVSFVLGVRGGGSSSGYVATGFWAGFMVGRVALLPLNKLIGETLAIYVYLIGCIGLELIIWFVPNLIVSALGVALVGLLFGPMFPIALNLAGRIIPPPLLTTSIAWLSGISIAGASVLPLITGAIAGSAGIESMVPVMIGLMVIMMVLWWFVPKKKESRRN